MYSVVLAAMLTTQPAAPQWGWHHGCHGCHGCWSCWGCYGCWGGCYGYGWGGYGYGWGGYGYGWGGYGYWGGCYGGAFGCAGGGYACLGCYGCYGWGGYVASAPVLPATAPAGGERGRDTMSYAAAPRAPATVVVNLPADAKLFADGKAIALDERNSFSTPKLVPGEAYTYTLKVQAVRNGRLVNETKDVQVWAGETTRVAFRDLAGGAPAAARAVPDAVPAPAQISVKLPDNAKLFVNDVACNVRTFNTPKLDPDREYSYTLKAEIGGRTESKVVRFRAGQPVTVDFTTPADVRTVSR